tara:strand:+ start:830 stop:1114 length:285 start_codon:yes stop_codon:yes gene_type:complete
MSFSPPKKLKNIPEDAQWLGGIGAGSWFHIQKKAEIYEISRFSPKGVLECSGVFINVGSNFNITEDYRFTYLSHCSLCSILQKGKIIIFKLNED